VIHIIAHRRDRTVGGLRYVAHDPGGDRVEGDEAQHAGHDHALVQGVHDLGAFGRLDEIAADDRGDDRDAAERQRIDDRLVAHVGEGQRADQHGRHHRHRVGLEQVGSHAGAIADVIAHVVGDHRRVTRVVFRDARFDLAHQVGPDVRTLGEDAAAQSGEDRDQRRAEGQADHRVQQVAHADARRRERLECRVEHRHPQQTEAHHQHAGDGAATERDVQRRVDALGRRLRGAHVGAHRDIHSDVAGRARQDGADRKADRGGQAEAGHDGDDHEQHHADDADGAVLAIQVRLRALLDRRGDLLHPRVARGLLHDPGGPQASKDDRDRAAGDRE